MPKARVLAVDDQRYFRELLEGLLTEDGYEVETVSSAEEALHVLERDSFDIVVTDLVMPGVDGTELVARIKKRLPEQEIVMVTGVVDVKTAVEAMKQGATDYILKPFDRNTLSNSLERILQRRRLRDEHSQLMTENLEFMGVLSLYERASGLFSTLNLEPLAARLIEGLCLETNAQGGVVWIAQDLESSQLKLCGARGIIRIDEEPEELALDSLDERFAELLTPGRSIVVPRSGGDSGVALFVPLRHAGQVIGIARLSDPLGGADFGDRERAAAEKFVGYGSTAVVNALRFRTLERRSFRDPTTRAYTSEFLQDAIRNEIQKASRFGRSFSIVHIATGSLGELRRRSSDREFTSLIVDLVDHLGAALRSTDLLASGEDGHYDVLLPETDAVGAAVLKQRIRSLVEESEIISSSSPEFKEQLALAVATYPTDGTQLESLQRVLEVRVEADCQSLLRRLALPGNSFSHSIDLLLEEGSQHKSELPVEVTRFLLEEVERRPRDRGLLFVSPGDAMLPIVQEGISRLKRAASNTEIVIVGDDPSLAEEARGVTCVTTQRAGTDRPFAVYYGEGPVYAMITEHRANASGMQLFHTDDRALVEYLAFQFQKDLGLPLGASVQ